MNSEELEVSLRSEFETYLKSLVGELKQEVSEFQEKLDAEFEKQKSRMDEAFEEFAARLAKERGLDAGFKDSVTEHLRLAKDEGARITATAMAEAEDLKAEQMDSLAPDTGFADIRDAVAEISHKGSQSEILKSLVHHASEYTPRGAFFIVKNEHLVGWRVFGKEDHEDPQAVREVYFPLSSKTLLCDAVSSLGTVQGNGEGYEDEEKYLEELGFGNPHDMCAIPLVARGRGVAVLYADGGQEGENVNIEALETLVAVAGLTVELLAASSGVRRSVTPAYVVEGAEPAPEEEEDFSSEYTDDDMEQPETAEKSVSFDDSYTEIDEESVSFDESHAEMAQESVSFEEPQTETEDYEGAAALDAGQDVGYHDDEDHGFEYRPADEVDERLSPGGDAGYVNDSEDFEPVYGDSADDTTYGSDAPEAVEPITEEFAEAFQPEEVEAETAIATDPLDAEVEQLYEVSDAVQVAEEVEPASAEFDEFEGEAHAVYDDEYVSEDTDNVGGFDFDSGTESKADEGSPEDTYSSQEMETAELDHGDHEQQESSSPFSFDGTEKDESPVAAESPVETVAVADGAIPIRPRFGDRNVDLPIEVSEDERRFHNDARRFARLLVSEIELYNKEKVKEGREAKDLYDRLREAIDRSREMYEKRVQAPVAAKFDYFNYELVNRLADGDESNLGNSYPGAVV